MSSPRCRDNITLVGANHTAVTPIHIPTHIHTTTTITPIRITTTTISTLDVVVTCTTFQEINVLERRVSVQKVCSHPSLRVLLLHLGVVGSPVHNSLFYSQPHILNPYCW